MHHKGIGYVYEILLKKYQKLTRSITHQKTFELGGETYHAVHHKS